MRGKTNYRNHRNNPYVIDDLFATMHRSAIGVIWRFRTETLTALTTGIGGWLLARSISIAGVLSVTIPLLAFAVIHPSSRRFLIRRIWCVISRHRMQKVFFETRMHTRSGRLSMILRIHPTEVGERALIWCRAGICFEDFEAHTGEIAAACYARETRVERSKRWAQIITVDIVRRDTLAARNVVVSGLALKPRQNEPGTDLDVAS